VAHTSRYWGIIYYSKIIASSDINLYWPFITVVQQKFHCLVNSKVFPDNSRFSVGKNEFREAGKTGVYIPIQSGEEKEKEC